MGKAEIEAEREAEREKRSRVVDEGTQSEAVGVTAIGAQTVSRTYASVLAD